MARSRPTVVGVQGISGRASGDTEIPLSTGATTARMPFAFAIRDVQQSGPDPETGSVGVDDEPGTYYAGETSIGAGDGGAFDSGGFSPAGTWTAFEGVHHIKVIGIGGGGGGGGPDRTVVNGSAGGGGGGGGSAVLDAHPVGYFETIACQLGQFGSAGANNSNGTNGSATWFRNTSTMFAPGGHAGVGALAGGGGGGGGAASSGAIGDHTFIGGAGLGGSSFPAPSIGGDGGGAAGDASSAVGHAGGAAHGRDGMPGGSSLTAIDASGYGAGGGGVAYSAGLPGSYNGGYLRIEANGVWDAQLVSFAGTGGMTISLFVDRSSGSPDIECRDNESYVSGSWVSAPGNFGIKVLGVKRVREVEDVINGMGSSLVQVNAFGNRRQATFMNTSGTQVVDLLDVQPALDVRKGDLIVGFVDVTSPTPGTFASGTFGAQPLRMDGALTVTVGDITRVGYWRIAPSDNSGDLLVEISGFGPCQYVGLVAAIRGAAPYPWATTPTFDTGRTVAASDTDVAGSIGPGETHTLTPSATGAGGAVRIDDANELVLAFLGQSANLDVDYEQLTVAAPTSLPSSALPGITEIAAESIQGAEMRAYSANAPAVGAMPVGAFSVGIDSTGMVGAGASFQALCSSMVVRGKLPDAAPYFAANLGAAQFQSDGGGTFDGDLTDLGYTARTGDLVLIMLDIVSSSIGAATIVCDQGADVGLPVVVGTRRTGNRTTTLWACRALTHGEISFHLDSSGWDADTARASYAAVAYADADRVDPIASWNLDEDNQTTGDAESAGSWEVDIAGTASAATDLLVAFISYATESTTESPWLPTTNDGTFPRTSPVASQTFPDLTPHGDVTIGPDVGAYNFVAAFDGPIESAGALPAGSLRVIHAEQTPADGAQLAIVAVHSVILRTITLTGGGGGDDDGDASIPPTPLPVPIVYGDPDYVDLVQQAIDRLPYQFRGDSDE